MQIEKPKCSCFEQNEAAMNDSVGRVVQAMTDGFYAMLGHERLCFKSAEFALGVVAFNLYYNVALSVEAEGKSWLADPAEPGGSLKKIEASRERFEEMVRKLPGLMLAHRDQMVAVLESQQATRQ